ncbi:MAG: winged helix-turn-helix domain-containing protein [Bacillota bacterium]
MDYRFRFWLVKNNRKVFGEGPLTLLKKVDELGSLRQAALAMGMSYSKAWKVMRQIERELQIKLLERTIGGKAGGGSTITSEAREFIERYEAFMASIDEKIKEEMQKYFML